MERKAWRHITTVQEGLWGDHEGQQDANKHAQEILHGKQESLEASFFLIIFFVNGCSISGSSWDEI